MRARWDGQLGMKEATLAPPKSSRFRALGCTSAILVVGCGLFSSGTQELRKSELLHCNNAQPGYTKCV